MIPDVVNLAYEKYPTKYAEAMRSSKRAGWEVAMREEISALQYNGVWLVKREAWDRTRCTRNGSIRPRQELTAIWNDTKRGSLRVATSKCSARTTVLRSRHFGVCWTHMATSQTRT